MLPFSFAPLSFGFASQKGRGQGQAHPSKPALLGGEQFVLSIIIGKLFIYCQEVGGETKKMARQQEIKKQIEKIEKNENFSLILGVIHSKLNSIKSDIGDEQKAYKEIFNQTHDIMREAEPIIEERLDERVANGEIRDKDQARKSIAGNLFQMLVLYLLLLNQDKGFLDKNIVIAKTKTHKIIDDHATIKVGNETQKPDVDLIAFKEDSDKVLIYSCKTSLRERAGQTYKWKLLLDIISTCDALKDKYQLSYEAEREVLTGFITPNFYNEINQPQQRGMIKFFDYKYIGKKVESDFISPLSEIIKDLTELFS